MNDALIEKLTNFLSGVKGKPIEWGVDDCTMQAHKWVCQSTGIAVPKLAYSDKKSAHDLIQDKGGLDEIWYEFMNPHFIMASEARYGDVGIINTHLYGDIGCIFAAGGIAAIRSDDGYRFINPTQKYIKQIWSLNL